MAELIDRKAVRVAVRAILYLAGVTEPDETQLAELFGVSLDSIKRDAEGIEGIAGAIEAIMQTAGWREMIAKLPTGIIHGAEFSIVQAAILRDHVYNKSEIDSMSEVFYAPKPGDSDRYVDIGRIVYRAGIEEGDVWDRRIVNVEIGGGSRE